MSWKMAVLAPIPRARVKTATRVKPGLRRRNRKAWRRSRGLSTENSDRAAVISERGGGREPLPSEGKTRVFTILQIFEMVRDEQDWSHHSRSGHTRRGSALGAPWRGMAS